MLCQNGYETVSAYSGTEGILAHSKDISLILMDLMLPGKNGEEIIEELKMKNNVPVIVTSAISDIDKKVELFSLGVDDYVTKPFHMDDFENETDEKIDTEHLFDEFYTSDISRSKGDSGLGLAIAKEFTELLSGVIGAEYRDGRIAFIIIWKNNY